MIETAEGIGGRKWSLGKDGDSILLMEGKNKLAELTLHGEKMMALLVTIPQLWDAANEACKAFGNVDISPAAEEAALQRLKNMVAKAVGKSDWKDVAQ